MKMTFVPGVVIVSSAPEGTLWS